MENWIMVLIDRAEARALISWYHFTALEEKAKTMHIYLLP